MMLSRVGPPVRVTQPMAGCPSWWGPAGTMGLASGCILPGDHISSSPPPPPPPPLPAPVCVCVCVYPCVCTAEHHTSLAAPTGCLMISAVICNVNPFGKSNTAGRRGNRLDPSHHLQSTTPLSLVPACPRPLPLILDWLFQLIGMRSTRWTGTVISCRSTVSLPLQSRYGHLRSPVCFLRPCGFVVPEPSDMASLKEGWGVWAHPLSPLASALATPFLVCITAQECPSV